MGQGSAEKRECYETLHDPPPPCLFASMAAGTWLPPGRSSGPPPALSRCCHCCPPWCAAAAGWRARPTGAASCRYTWHSCYCMNVLRVFGVHLYMPHSFMQGATQCSCLHASQQAGICITSPRPPTHPHPPASACPCVTLPATAHPQPPPLQDPKLSVPFSLSTHRTTKLLLNLLHPLNPEPPSPSSLSSPPLLPAPRPCRCLC